MAVPFTSFIYDSTDADVRNWYRRVLREGEYGVSSARMALLDTLVGGLKSDGVWSKLDRLWLFAAENQIAARVDLVGGTLATVVGSPTFTTDRGFNTASTSNYINTNFNPTSGSPLYSRDSAHFSAWNVDNSTGAGSDQRFISNAKSGTDYSHMYPRFGATSAFGRINATSGGSVTVTDVAGLNHVNRSASSAQQYYKNGSSVGTDTQASTALIDAPFTCLVDLFLVAFNGAQIGQCSMGSSLSSTDASNFYIRLRTYMTAIGVP